MKVKFANKTKLGGKWYPALEEVEIDVSEQKKFLKAGALLVAEYVFIDEEEPVQEKVQEPEVQEEVVEEPVVEKPKKPAPKKNAKKK